MQCGMKQAPVSLLSHRPAVRQLLGLKLALQFGLESGSDFSALY